MTNIKAKYYSFRRLEMLTYFRHSGFYSCTVLHRCCTDYLGRSMEGIFT